MFNKLKLRVQKSGEIEKVRKFDPWGGSDHLTDGFIHPYRFMYIYRSVLHVSCDSKRIALQSISRPAFPLERIHYFFRPTSLGNPPIYHHLRETKAVVVASTA